MYILGIIGLITHLGVFELIALLVLSLFTHFGVLDLISILVTHPRSSILASIESKASNIVANLYLSTLIISLSLPLSICPMWKKKNKKKKYPKVLPLGSVHELFVSQGLVKSKNGEGVFIGFKHDSARLLPHYYMTLHYFWVTIDFPSNNLTIIRMRVAYTSKDWLWCTWPRLGLRFTGPLMIL